MKASFCACESSFLCLFVTRPGGLEKDGGTHLLLLSVCTRMQSIVDVDCCCLFCPGLHTLCGSDVRRLSSDAIGTKLLWNLVVLVQM